ncbi:MAK10-like protein [Tanacetum coccineum]
MKNKNPIRTLGDYSRPSHEGYRNTIELPGRNFVVPIRSDTIRLMQNGCSFHGVRYEDPNQHLKDFLKVVDSLDLDVADRTAKLHNDILMFQQHQGEFLSEGLIEDLALYDNESWNDPRDFAKQVKAVSLPQDIPSTSDHRLIELENQVQRLMEVHIVPNPPVQGNKMASSCEICSGPHDTQYCMENPKQAFVDYASSRTDEAGGKWFTFKPLQNNLGDTYNRSWKSHSNLRLSKFEADFKQQQSEMTNKIDTFLKAINDLMTLALPSDTVKNPKLNANPTSSVSSTRIVKNVEVHLGKLKLLEDFYVIDIEKDPATPLLIGRGFLATASAVIDCDEDVPYWTTLGKRESYELRPSTDGIGARPPYYAKKDFMDYHLTGNRKLLEMPNLTPLRTF